jgi:hypothetical protein
MDVEKLEIDQEAATSWRAFKYLRVLNGEDSDAVAKMDAAIGYAGLVAHMSEEDIVELAGGDDAQVADVMEIVTNIISKATPKN